MSAAIGIDTGGTFTDLVAFDAESGEIRTLKTSSMPATPGQAIVNALSEGGDRGGRRRRLHARHDGRHERADRADRLPGRVPHDAGFEDTPYIQRINRKVLYDLRWTKPEPLVSESPALPRRGRAARPTGQRAHGGRRGRGARRSARRLARAAPRRWRSACSSLTSTPSTRSAVQAIVEEELPGVPVSVSHEVAPIWREYERSSTDDRRRLSEAAARPLRGESRPLAARCRAWCGAWTIMKSNGGAMRAGAAADTPIQTVMSGPAGGMIATGTSRQARRAATCSRSTWAAPAPTSGWSSTASSGRRPSTRSSGACRLRCR